MMSPVAFIIGSGSNVGFSTAALFKKQGYAVAIGSRNPNIDKAKEDGYFPVSVEAGNPESIKDAFWKVNKELGPPGVVVFNREFNLTYLILESICLRHYYGQPLLSQCRLIRETLFLSPLRLILATSV